MSVLFYFFCRPLEMSVLTTCCTTFKWLDPAGCDAQLDSDLAIWLASSLQVTFSVLKCPWHLIIPPNDHLCFTTLCFYLINKNVGLHHWLQWFPCGFIFRGVTKAWYCVNLLPPLHLFFFLLLKKFWSWNDQYSYSYAIWDSLCKNEYFFSFQASFPLLWWMPPHQPTVLSSFADPISTGPLSLAPQHLCAWCTTAESILIESLSPHWNFAQWQHLNCSKLLIASVLDRELINPDISNTF